MSNLNVVAIANQKGGVGKTTTAINLGAALAQAGKSTIIIDLDPQGNASTGLGIPAAERKLTVYDLLMGQESLDQVLIDTKIPNLQIVPSTPDLSSADIDLSSSSERTRILMRKLANESPTSIILIDCPPALGLLTLNALVAASSVLVPLQTEFYALEGLSQLLKTVKHVRQSANPALRINGILLTMSDYRNNLSQQVEADARETLGDLVYTTVIPRNIRLSEAPSHALPVLNYDPMSKGSIAYKNFALEFTDRMNQAKETAQ